MLQLELQLEDHPRIAKESMPTFQVKRSNKYGTNERPYRKLLQALLEDQRTAEGKSTKDTVIPDGEHPPLEKSTAPTIIEKTTGSSSTEENHRGWRYTRT